MSLSIPGSELLSRVAVAALSIVAVVAVVAAINY